MGNGGIMRSTGQRTGRTLLLLFGALLALPLVSARDYFTGISPLNKVVQTMSWIFTVPILQDATVQQGFIRFGLFLIFLSVAHWVFKKLFKDNKTSGVIATAFALIAAFLMPRDLVLVNGGVITVVLAGLIPLALIGMGMYFSVSTKMLNRNFALRLLAIVILFTLMAIIEVYQGILGARLAGGAGAAVVAMDVLRVMLDWLNIALVITIIYMLFALVTGGEGLGGLGGLFGGGDGDESDRRHRRTSDRRGTSDDSSGPKDTSEEYPDWQDGFGTLSVWVTDLDDKGIQGARVVIKHRKLPGLKRKMQGPTGPNGTYGPARIPAGQIRVKVSHRHFIQYVTAAFVGGVFAGFLGALAGMGLLSTNRYVDKDWFFLEKDQEAVLHVRLKRRKGEKDHAFEPKIYPIVLDDRDAKDAPASRLRGRIEA